jgi:uncharacterized protein
VVYVDAPKRERVLEQLRSRRAELERLGAAHLYLYGSVAREEASAESDVDLLIEPKDERFSLFDLMRVQDACTEMLGRRAELHDFRGLKRAQDLLARVEPDLVHVF